MSPFTRIAVSPALQLQRTHSTFRRLNPRLYSTNTPVASTHKEEFTKFIAKNAGSGIDYPDLMTPDPLLDTQEVILYPPDPNGKGSRFTNRVIIRNDENSRLFLPDTDSSAGQGEHGSSPQTESDGDVAMDHLPLSSRELNKLHKYPILTRRITQQTGKGKIHRQYCMMVVGNGDGLVGLGEGKDEDLPRAVDKAFVQAVRHMDCVDRFEKRTIWTEMETKLGATRIILRPRPVGFGLRCNPNIHQVLKAAGIKDISAKVWGSRNPLNVVKALFRTLQAGHAPLSMGDGIGGGGRKLNKGSGIRNKSDVERERGRKLVDLRD